MGCNVSSSGCNAVDAAMLLLKNGGGGVTPEQLEEALAAKADKVSGAVAGNLAALDENGNLTDSGRKTTDFGRARDVEILYKLAKGQIYDTQTDTQAAYTKTVPSGAVAAEIASIGGKTVVWNQCLINTTLATLDNIAPGNRTVASVDAGVLNLKKSESGGLGANARLYATAFNAAHKYYMRAMARKSENATDGALISFTAANYTTSGNNTSAYTLATDFTLIRSITSPAESGHVFCARSGSSTSAVNDIDAYFKDIRVVDLTLMYGAGNEPATISDPRIAEIEAYLAVHPNYDTGSPLSTAVTSIVSRDGDAETLDTLEIPAAVRALEGYGQSAVGGDGNILDLPAGTYTEIGHYVDGVWTALAEPVVTDVSSLLPDNMLDVEAGGSLTFVQEETAFQVPNSVDYLIKLSEVTA